MMKKILFPLLGVIGPAMSGFLAASEFVDLQSAYVKALNHLEDERIGQSRVDLSAERENQVRSGLLPKASLDGNHYLLDKVAGQKDSSTLVKVNVQQPVFRGMAEFATLRLTREEKEAALLRLDQTRQDLYKSVSAAYFQVLIAEKDVENLKNQGELTRERVTNLKQRVGIGRSRKAELLAAQGQVAFLEAQTVAGEGLVRRERARLALMTGLPEKVSLAPVADITTPLLPLSHYLKAMEDRPDHKAFAREMAIREEGLVVARASHYPRVDLAGNYYIKRTGVLSGSDWDVGVLVTFPLYQGGETESKVREAGLQKISQHLIHQQQRRESEALVRDLYEKIRSSEDELISLRRALTIFKATYEQQKEEYHLGLVPHLEVLQALNSYLENKRQVDRTALLLLSQRIALEATVGKRQ